MIDAIVYDTHPQNMDLKELRAAFDALPNYPQKDFDFQLMTVIGEYMDGRGVAFPGMDTLGARLHCFKMTVKRGVDRMLKFKFLAVEKTKSEGARWAHNVYTIARRFLRKTVDKLSRHFDAQKWKVWVEEKMSARQRKKLVVRYCRQAGTDLDNAGVWEGHWMAMRYVCKHVGETPEEYEAILQEAIQKYRDFEGPLYREIEDRPGLKSADPVPAPVSEPAASASSSEPVETVVSEEDMAKMFRVFDAHPELVNNPEEAAVMAGVVFPDMKTSKPAPVQEPATKPANTLVKQVTDLESLPANTQPANVQTNIPANTQAENVPKFINGEPSALWRSQQLLHQVNPTMYPAW